MGFNQNESKLSLGQKALLNITILARRSQARKKSNGTTKTQKSQQGLYTEYQNPKLVSAFLRQEKENRTFFTIMLYCYIQHAYDLQRAERNIATVLQKNSVILL